MMEKDADIKAFAAKTLPTLRAHLDPIKAIKASIDINTISMEQQKNFPQQDEPVKKHGDSTEDPRNEGM